MQSRHFLWAFVFFAVPIPSPARCDDRPATRALVKDFLHQIERVRSYREAAISPDGQYVAWVEEVKPTNARPEWGLAIFVRESEGHSKPIRLSADPKGRAHMELGVSWSPDSSEILFLSNFEREDQYQIYAAPATGGTARQLTHVRGLIAGPRWSPDGKRLAFQWTETNGRASGPLQPGASQTGVIEERVDEQRLAVLDPASGAIRKLTPDDLYVYEFDWSPDGKRLAAIAAHGSGDNNWYVAEIFTVEADSGTTRSILKPDMQIAFPRWSPDGSTIAFIGGLMSDEGVIGGDIYTIPAVGGMARDLTPEFKGSASDIAWERSGKRIIFTEHLDGGSAIGTLETENGKIQMLWQGAETVWSESGMHGTVSFAADCTTSALVRCSFDMPPGVWAGAIGSWTEMTYANRGLKRAAGDVQSLHWKSDDFMVQGWLMYPKTYDANKRYPLVVQVHGGPAGVVQPRWASSFFDGAVLSQAGCFVLYPNPRGSYGQGERFTRANVKDFGYGDFRDIMAGVDEVIRTRPIDQQRLGIMGWSYGGYMTMWAVTQTKRFQAAVVGAGLSNWQSYYGENGIDQWMIPYFGASVYDDPAVYAKSSPINFVKNAKTPTLILVGERDVECPAPQSFEFWHALKTLKVPCQLVVYANEGHAIFQPEHREDILMRTMGWFEKYLK
jgi:dipeptidyl aminopeptidase/acylaminoacyl peptidase